jgi:hypothetical protein
VAGDEHSEMSRRRPEVGDFDRAAMMEQYVDVLLKKVLTQSCEGERKG